MRRLFSNLVIISLGLLGAIAKWGGLVMDVIGLPEAGSQLDGWISQLEIGDGAYILIVVSIFLLLIINGPALRRVVLKPKARTYGIEEIRELSGVLSPKMKWGRVKEVPLFRHGLPALISARTIMMKPFRKLMWPDQKLRVNHLGNFVRY